MNHLEIDDIISFVSLTEINDEAIKLLDYVNGHIRKCGSCLNLVRAFQMIYDEFSNLDTEKTFREYVLRLLVEQSEKEYFAKTQDVDDELDKYM